MKINNSMLVIGLGNKYRKDDGVGLYTAEKIKAMKLDDVKVIDGVSDGAALMNIWSNDNAVFIIDAVISSAKSGTVYRFDALNETIPGEIFTGYSTHSISLVESIELAKSLGEIPDSLIVFGIEGIDFSAGIGLTPEVESAAYKVIDLIEKEINNISKQ